MNVIITMLSNTNFGDAAYYLMIFSLCLWLSEHPFDLFIPYISLPNISGTKVSLLFPFCVSCVGSIGMKIYILCSCVNSFVTAFSPLSASIFKPVLNFYRCIKTIPMISSANFSSENRVTSCT